MIPTSSSNYLRWNLRTLSQASCLVRCFIGSLVLALVCIVVVVALMFNSASLKTSTAVLTIQPELDQPMIMHNMQHSNMKSHSDSATKHQTVLSALNTTPIKIEIDGIPLEKVNTNYTHNIHFSVKSSGTQYKKRLLPLMLTWFQVVDKDELTIISDNSPAGKPYLNTIRKAGFNIVVSSCRDDHSYNGLCCKTGNEFSSYYKALEEHSDKRDRYQWYCHFDDDIYVNVPQLSRVLQQYDSSKPYYIGKYPWRLRHDLPYVAVSDRAKAYIRQMNLPMAADTFQYATGSTYCASRALVMKGKEFLNGKHKFIQSCILAGHADDITVGFIIGAILGFNLTEIDNLYNQFNKMNKLSFSKEEMLKFLTVSYLVNEIAHKITRTVPLQSNITGDTTKFMAYHCLLYPSVSWCPR